MFAIAEKHNVEIHMYAVDTQLYVPFSVQDYELAIAKLEACIAEIHEWLTENHL
jgi:hypothetical protein